MRKLSILFMIFFIGQLFVINAHGQYANSGSPYDREFGDIKLLDAYFGTFEQKIEVDSGDQNVPLTVVMANVGTQDITGIRGQLSLSPGFTPSDGKGALILADKDDNSLAGDIFSLTFFVNVDKDLAIGQYPGTIKVDYSRLRESGQRSSFFDFDFKLTGDSTLNIKAIDPVLISIKNNLVVVEVSNLGTAPISNIEIVLQNTQTSVSSTAQSVTNLENVVFDQNTWDIGTIDPKSSNRFSFNVYVPENLKDEPLHAPVEITYYDAHGNKETITRTIDFYINGLIQASIYNVDVIELSKKQTVIGEILNEGNVDGLFAFVTLEPRGDSNIKKSTQYIDKLEPDSPVPFNIPIEFDGEPRAGEHDIRIIAKYKDSLRNENTITYDTTVFYRDTSKDGESGLSDISSFIILGIVVVAGIFAYTKIKKRKKTPDQTS